MRKYVVIVEPLSSGIELAPAFRALDVHPIALTLSHPEWKGYGNVMQSENFAAIMPMQAGIETLLQPYKPIAIIPGVDEAVATAEKLTFALTPHLANDATKLPHRLHKAKMQAALAAAHVPYLATMNTCSISEAAAWLTANNFADKDFILKPPASAGSDNVFHISAGQHWQPAFMQILNTPSALTGQANTSVVIQEKAAGIEFAVGTVSANGQHQIAHLIQYRKLKTPGFEAVYDYVEFIDYKAPQHQTLLTYTCQVLDALGVRWGAAHIEIMMTANGPRLIEIGARMIGGPAQRFARAATGSCQVDQLAALYTHGKLALSPDSFHDKVRAVFLRSNRETIAKNMQIFNTCETLPTFFEKHLWYQNNESIPKTINYLTNLGIIALSGPESQMDVDYLAIRKLEQQFNHSA